MKVYGIIGHPVTHSLSPAMFNAAIAHIKLDAEYRTFDIDPSDPENLANFCYETDINEIAGLSVTMPYKQAIMAYMDHYDPLAKIIGAVNTVVNEESKLIGYNTDSMGAMQALRQATDLGKKVLVMGAGGAARAIAYGLKGFQADVFIYNRTPEKAEAIAEEWELETIELKHIPQANFDIIINATSVGSHTIGSDTLVADTPTSDIPTTRFANSLAGNSLTNAESSLLHADQIPSTAVVMDIVTNPIKTQLLKEAEKAGTTTVSGERMLLWQAVDQFKLFFDQEAPIEVMEQAMYDELGKRK
jgi:shikimate dehydrogenase